MTDKFLDYISKRLSYEIEALEKLTCYDTRWPNEIWTEITAWGENKSREAFDDELISMVSEELERMNDRGKENQ